MPDTVAILLSGRQLRAQLHQPRSSNIWSYDLDYTYFYVLQSLLCGYLYVLFLFKLELRHKSCHSTTSLLSNMEVIINLLISSCSQLRYKFILRSFCLILRFSVFQNTDSGLFIMSCWKLFRFLSFLSMQHFWPNHWQMILAHISTHKLLLLY